LFELWLLDILQEFCEHIFSFINQKKNCFRETNFEQRIFIFDLLQLAKLWTRNESDLFSHLTSGTSLSFCFVCLWYSTGISVFDYIVFHLSITFVSLNLFNKPNKLSLSIPCSTEIKGKESLNSSQFAFVLTKLLLNSTFIRSVTYEIATQHNSSHHSKSSYIIYRIDRSPIPIMPITQENKIRSWILEMERFCLPSFDQQSYKIHYLLFRSTFRCYHDHFVYTQGDDE
jgi:hypothetical protein